MGLLKPNRHSFKSNETQAFGSYDLTNFSFEIYFNPFPYL